jgi:hypothetical protein
MKEILLFTCSLVIAVVVEAQIIHVPAGQQEINGPVIRQSVFFLESVPIREMTVVLPGEHPKEQRIVPNRFPHHPELDPEKIIHPNKPELQKTTGFRKTRGPLLNFEGVGNVNSVYPADPNGDVGLNHYIQTVNNSFAVWDKNGSPLYGPVDNKTIFASFPGPWSTSPYYWSDPVFKFDQLANRWIIISIAFTANVQLSCYTMAAVSTTEDPLGSYYCYFFQFSDLNDYPKISIWPDGYYFTYNMWGPASFLYSLVEVADRNAMLSGAPQVSTIGFQVPNTSFCTFFPMPADLRGTNVPEGSPCYIVTPASHDTINPWHFWLDLYAFYTDWNAPANSTLEPVTQFDLGEFEPILNFGPGAPQPGNPVNVMTIPVYMMYPLTYRQFSDHQTMVCCHTMWDGEINYIKWYELRQEQSAWYIYQTGNYAPGDLHYYMPSISINGNGDIGLGYSVSSETNYPSIRFTGRREDDMAGMMTFSEIELFKGLNYSNSYQFDFDQNRWGDYSSMMVDPADDSTFWYTNMYTKAVTTPGNWATRIFALNLVEEELLPVAIAGDDTLTCNVMFFTTQGGAQNYSSIVWTSSGDGNFLSNNTLSATYLRGPGDIQNQQVTLTLHATGYYPGSEASDSMILYINKMPEVNAGVNISIAAGESVSLQGEVLYSYACQWATTGDGTFNDNTLPDAIYTPGQQDIANGQVVLTLTAWQVTPCTGSDADSLTVFIFPVGIDTPLGNSLALKVFPNPVQGMAEIECTTTGAGPLTIHVLDIKGCILFSGRYQSKDGKFGHILDFSLLPPGHYFIRVSLDASNKTIKIIKH